MRLDRGRVLMIVHAYYKQDTRVRREAEALVRAGKQVDVICLNKGGEPKHEFFQGVQIHRCNLSRSRVRTKLTFASEYLRFVFLALFTCTRLFLKGRHKVVIAHNMPNFLVFAALLPRLTGAEVVLDLHDASPEVYRDLFRSDSGLLALLARLSYLEERLSVAFASRVMTVNETVKELFERRNGRDFFLVHNSPDEQHFPEQKTHYRQRVEDPVRLLFHGHIHRRSGLDRVLETMQRLDHGGNWLTLEVHGAGPYYETLRRRAEDLGVLPRCDFHGAFTAGEISSNLIRADLAVVPYEQSEMTDLSLPVKILEYFYIGIPVVCTRLKTTQRYFNEDCLFYFDTDNEFDAILNSIRFNYSEAILKSEKAKQAFSPLSWRLEGTKYVDFIESLCGGQP